MIFTQLWLKFAINVGSYILGPLIHVFQIIIISTHIFNYPGFAAIRHRYTFTILVIIGVLEGKVAFYSKHIIQKRSVKARCITEYAVIEINTVFTINKIAHSISGRIS